MGRPARAGRGLGSFVLPVAGSVRLTRSHGHRDGVQLGWRFSPEPEGDPSQTRRPLAVRVPAAASTVTERIRLCRVRSPSPSHRDWPPAAAASRPAPAATVIVTVTVTVAEPGPVPETGRRGRGPAAAGRAGRGREEADELSGDRSHSSAWKNGIQHRFRGRRIQRPINARAIFYQ